jgi:hypothetical protein
MVPRREIGSGMIAKAAMSLLGSKADIPTSPLDVRFTPNNGHWVAHPRRHLIARL